MNNVTKFRDTRRLGVANFCNVRMLEWGSTLQAWTDCDLPQALATPDYLRTMQHAVRVGDTIELFQVPREHLEFPERDPLAMASLLVTHFTEDRGGLHMHFVQSQPILRFSPGEGRGIEVAPWQGKFSVWRDGERIGNFNTKIEAVERGENLRNPKGAAERADAILRQPPVKPATVSLPVPHYLRREDIAYTGPFKIARTLSIRTLSPIADVLADPQYTSRVASCFRSTDRVTFMRFGSDIYSTVIEMLNLALADVVAGRVKFYAKDEIRKTGREPETGPVAQQVGGRWTLRVDGRTVESFADAQRLEWHCQHKGIAAKMLKAA